MTPTQRAAAERLAKQLDFLTQPFAHDAADLLRELAAEPAQEPVAWHVCSVNSDGSLSLEFAAPWEELALTRGVAQPTTF